MEKLSYTVELADNGIIVHDNVSKSKDVYQRKGEQYGEYFKRGLSESVASCIADILLNGTDNLPTQDKYNIKIEIR